MDNSRKPPRPLLAGPLVAGTVAALAARGAYAGLRRRPPAGEKTWTRTNHRGELVTLLEGPAVALGVVAGTAGASRRDLAVTTATLGALGFGVLDDLRGSGKRRGLRGHLGALAHGEVTTGAVKLAGLAVTGLGAALIDGGDPADVAINAGLIAGAANLLNLFDLRPGRAIKVAAGTAALIAGTAALAGDGSPRGIAAVAAPAGAALALLPEDLAERAMLGDAGANALGAALGASAARTLPRPARAGLLAAIVALTLASEKVSFTRVIERTPPLRWLDMLGRRPVPRAVPLTDGPLSGDPLTAAPFQAAPVAADEVHGGRLPMMTTPASRRRPPGRHRRAAEGDRRNRSGGWILALLKSPARQEP